MGNHTKDKTVYVAFLYGQAAYVGMGAEDRHKHVTSGVSHVYEANKAHFDNLPVVVEVLSERFSLEEANEMEEFLISELNPLWNIAHTKAFEYRKDIGRSLKFFKGVPEREFSFLLLKSLSKRLDNDRTVVFRNSDLDGKLSHFHGSFQEGRTSWFSPLIEDIERLSKGCYKITVTEGFLRNPHRFSRDESERVRAKLGLPRYSHRS